MWNVVYVECYIMQNVESYDVMRWCGTVVKKTDVAYAMCCAIVVRQMWKMMQL